MTFATSRNVVYTPPADGKPRNAVDAKWMKLHRAMLNRPTRAMKKADCPHLTRR